LGSGTTQPLALFAGMMGAFVLCAMRLCASKRAPHTLALADSVSALTHVAFVSARETGTRSRLNLAEIR